LTDLAAAFTAIGSTTAAVIILFELRHMDKHKNLEITMKLFEWAETDKLRKAFRWIEKEFQYENFEKYKADVPEKFEVSDFPYQVEAYFEQVGFLVNKKFVDIDIIVDRLGVNIISNWTKLKPWIMDLRKERADETFGEHFQRLYENTVEFMKKKNLPIRNQS
jgi:hypothetical protein